MMACRASSTLPTFGQCRAVERGSLPFRSNMALRDIIPGPGLLTLILLAVGALFWATRQDGQFEKGRVEENQPTIVYAADGGADGELVSIHYVSASGGTDDVLVPLPWSYSFALSGAEHLRLSVQRKGRHAGTVRAVISVDGSTLHEATTNDPHGSAMASGYVQ